jgi:hypothetical protein
VGADGPGAGGAARRGHPWGRRNVRAGTLGPDRERVARFLIDHPETPGDEAAAALGLTPSRWWVLVQAHWFDFTGKGWYVTAAGKLEAFGNT